MKRILQLLAMVAWFFSCAVHAQYKPPVSTVLAETSYFVNQDGSYHQELESQTRIETAQGVNAFAEERLSYISTLEDLEIVEAYTLQPDGSKIPVAPESIRTLESADASEAPTFSDAKVKVIVFPKVDVGSQLYYKARYFQHTPLFPGHFFTSTYFSPHKRYGNVTIHISHDPAIAIQIDTKEMRGGKVAALPSDQAGWIRYRYDYSQTEAYPAESSQLSVADFAPYFAATSMANYEELARAYQSRAKASTRVTPAIAKLAAKITSGTNEPLEKVRRLYSWVSQNIRYIAIYAGAGGFVPHDAQSILDHRYGDCKDHVVLLESLLQSIGIESSPALINYGNSHRLPNLALVTPFNHVITYVPSFNLFLDSTTQFAPMGTLPDKEMDKPVLLTSNGKILRTPSFDTQKDFSQTFVQMTLMPDGKMLGKSHTQMHGFLEQHSRASQFGYQNQEPERVVTRLLSRFQETGTGKIQSGNPKDLGAPWSVDAEFELDPLVNVPGPSAMGMPTGLAPGILKAMSGYKPARIRRFPHSCISVRHEETLDVLIPKEIHIERVPKGIDFVRGGVQYKSRYTLQGNTLNVRREYIANRPTSICGEEDDQLWRELVPVLQRDLRSQIFFN